MGKVKSQVSKERGAPGQDEVLPYLLDQIMNILFHSANVAEIFAEDGRIEQVDRPHLLYTRPRTRFVAGFIGRTTLLEARLARGGDARAVRQQDDHRDAELLP